MKRVVTGLLWALVLGAGGCADPLSVDNTLGLRDQIIAAQKRQLEGVKDAQAVEPKAEPGDLYLEKEPDRIKQLDTISGPAVYTKETIDLGPGLDAAPMRVTNLSLQQAIRRAVSNNLDLKIAQLQPAVSEAQVAAAEAIFDAVFYTDVNYTKVDRPRPQPLVSNGLGGLTPVGASATSQNTATLETGIRKPLETGGRLQVSSGLDYTEDHSPNFAQSPNPSFVSNILVGVSQPLLRNFGTYVNRSQIMITRNAHRNDVLAMQSQMLTTLGQVEAAYWNLIFARRQYAIQQRLLKMTLDTRDTIFARAQFDVNPVQKAQAQAFVENRRNDLIKSGQTMRDASDTLKRLINDPDMPLSDETLIVPSDDPIEVSVGYNLLDAVTTALKSRPEVRQALLNIDDASIRQAVADNQRLPQLNLNASVQYRGLSEEVHGSFDRLTDANFIDYVIGGQFETPIGNRAAEADFRRTRIARQQTVIAYQNTAQGIVLEVKTALRELQTAWKLIGVNRAARRAAAENLRALLEREERGEALTPEFLLDLKLNTQQRLADAETRELQSVVDYNNAIVRLHQATGTLLEHDQIKMEWPKDMFSDK